MRARINNASPCRSSRAAHKYPNVDGSDDLAAHVDCLAVIVQRFVVSRNGRARSRARLPARLSAITKRS